MFKDELLKCCSQEKVFPSITEKYFDSDDKKYERIYSENIHERNIDPMIELVKIASKMGYFED